LILKGKRIYLTSTKQVQAQFKLTNDVPVTNCSCSDTQVLLSCSVTKNGFFVTFNMTKNTGGYCDLRSDAGAVFPIALLG
jgi:hypothetical protein